MSSAFDTSFGAMLLGVLMSSILFGITNLQVYIYFKTYTKDPLWTKFSVCALWTIDALCVAFSFHLIYQYFITNYFNPVALLVINWSFKHGQAQDISSPTSSQFKTLVDASANRDSGLRYFLPGIASIFVCAGYGEMVTKSFSKHNTNRLLLTVISYEIIYWDRYDHRGVSLLSFIHQPHRVPTLKTSPHTFIVAAIEFLLTKIYVNSFLAMLNARNSLRDSGARMRRDYVLNTLQPTVTSEVTDESKPPELPQVLNIRNDTDSDSDGPRPYTDVEIDKPAARGYVPPAVSKGGIKEEVLESPSKQRASYPGPLLAPPQAHVYDTIHDTARSMPRHEKTLRESKDKESGCRDLLHLVHTRQALSHTAASVDKINTLTCALIMKNLRDIFLEAREICCEFFIRERRVIKRLCQLSAELRRVATQKNETSGKCYPEKCLAANCNLIRVTFAMFAFLQLAELVCYSLSLDNDVLGQISEAG
ncbi:predicted protein [Postia placenta Mad-698-R]|nr:predicted protein [Postia placenta Mad-698-R]